jgi:hypothetical protein
MSSKTTFTVSTAPYEPDINEIDGWVHELEALHARLAPRLARAEPRLRSQGFLKSLLSHIERKSGWHSAKTVGERTPTAWSAC